MNISKITIYVTIFLVVMIIGVPTFYKVIKNNNKKISLVTEKKIIEKAYECIYDGKCTSNKVYLKELYDNKYLRETLSDPVSKTIYSEDSFVLINKNEANFNPIF